MKKNYTVQETIKIQHIKHIFGKLSFKLLTSVISVLNGHQTFFLLLPSGGDVS